MTNEFGIGKPSHSTRRLHRRRMLQLTGLGGIAALAGCLGGGSSASGDQTGNIQDFEGNTTNDIDPGELDDVEGQYFRIPTTTEIEEFHWFHPDETGFRDWELPTYEHGAWGAWSHTDYLGAGELNLLQYENVDYAEDRIEITVSEDAQWSNGEGQVTGRDAIFQPIKERIRTGRRSIKQMKETEATSPPEAITDFEYDGRTGILHSEGGHFGDFPKQTVWQSFFVEYGPRIPTHYNHFEEYANAVFDIMQRAVDGNAAPWEDGSGLSTSDIKEELWGSDTDYLKETYRNPENVVVNGAWTLEEIRGDQSVWLRPNENHRNYDQINFDRIEIEFVNDANDLWANISSQRLDLAEAEPDQQTAGSFPESTFMHLLPDNNGTSIDLNLKSEESTSNVRVRQAILAALDTESICEAMNPDTWEAVSTPGADNPGTPEFLDDSWYEDNLMTYGNDTELAEDLMEEAGYERNDNETWVDGDGEEATFEIYTTNGNAEVEQYIVEDLEEFGIVANYTTQEPTIHEDNLDSGNLAAWTGNQNSGFAATAATPFTYVMHHENIMQRHGWFEGDLEENIDQTPYDDDGWPTSENPDDLEHLTIRAPPVGEFWADESEWESWPVVSMSYRLQSADQEELEELFPQLLWISNWFLAGIPIANRYKQYWLNTKNWTWPLSENYEMTEYVSISTRLAHQDLLARGDRIFANQENTRDDT